ncbi:MAG: hypothetical protein WC699_12095 [Bacteroidales bacterium]|jgi:hypothetical protein
MVRKIAFLALFLLAGAVFVSSCKKEELSSKKEVLSFIFEASKNAQLDRVFMGEIVGTNISAEIAFGASVNQLVPTIEISPRASLSPSPDVPTDFTGPVVYTVTAEDGTTKEFTASVANAPAPYIGKWEGGPIDFGMGLMHVAADITADGVITLQFEKLLTSEIDANSLKGTFNPVSMQNTEIHLMQTHRWGNNDWVSESADRTLMYQVITAQTLKLYYCLDYPRTDWCFQMNLTKQ